MAWTAILPSTMVPALSNFKLHSLEKVIHDQVNQCDVTLSLACPVGGGHLTSRRAIRTNAAGEDGLPQRRPNVVLGAYRQADGDEACLRENKEKLSAPCRKVVDDHGG